MPPPVPTRITETSFTLIDHFYTSNVDKIVSSGVIHTGLSDHSMIYASWGRTIKQKTFVHKYKVNRKYNRFDDKEFVKHLNRVQWCQVTDTNEVNEAVMKFESLFLPICNKHAPLRRKRVRKQNSPWITNDIIQLMHKRDNVKKKAIASGSSQQWATYKYLRNKVNYAIKESKRSYLTQSVYAAKKDSREIWKTLRNVVPGKVRSTNVTCIRTEDSDCTDPKNIANFLNDHFATVGPKLAAKIPNITHQNSSSDDLDESGKFKFQRVSEEYILKQLKSLSDGKATGTDETPAKLLKLACHSIVVPITHIINLSISTNVFPDKWKSARISPIFKSGDSSDVNNYRPISILPVLSKLLERSIFDQLYPFLDAKGLLHEKQSGFRPKYSTCTALINVTEDWYTSIDNDEYVGVVMLDLKKAFDTVSHNILVNKLRNYDISKHCVEWFKSYLSGRTHVTCVNSVTSEPSRCTCGIPQGSILGPLLFIIYINDLPSFVKNVEVSMYADDTVLYTSSKQISTLVKTLNDDLSNVNKWLIENKLSLNVDKSEVMIISTRHKLSSIDYNNINVNVNGVRLQNVNKCKHLGVIIDDKLTWRDQVDKVRKKVLVGTYMLRKAKSLIPPHTLTMLYNSIIAPHFDQWRN